MRYTILLLAWLGASVLSAQSVAILSGTVTDPNDRAVQNARVMLSHGLSGFERETHTQADGTFSLPNLPYQSYALAVSKDGFAEERQTVVLRSNVPVSLAVQLRISEHSETVSVSAFGSRALVEPEATGTRTELTASIIERMPTSIGARRYSPNVPRRARSVRPERTPGNEVSTYP